MSTCEVLTVVSPVVVKLLVVQVDDVSTHIIQEALVMRNYEQRLLPALKVAVMRRGDTQLLRVSSERTERLKQ